MSYWDGRIAAWQKVDQLAWLYKNTNEPAEKARIMRQIENCFTWIRVSGIDAYPQIKV